MPIKINFIEQTRIWLFKSNLAMPLSVRAKMRVGQWQSCENLGSWWREIGMCACRLPAGPDGSVRELLA